MNKKTRGTRFLARLLVVMMIASVLIIGPRSVASADSEFIPSLSNPEGVAIFDGGLFYVEGSESRVSRLDIATGTITTIAGNGSRGFSGDGGPATNAQLRFPEDIAVDSNGNVYITDTDNHRIRKVDTNGIITTIAGSGATSYGRDGVPATSARINFPHGIDVDSIGNLYFADAGNSRVHKVDTNGIITTIAGTGAFGFSGDGGPATNAQLDYPSGLAVDTDGNIYITELGNARIRTIDTNGIITTIAGTGTSGFSGDGGPATNAQIGAAGAVAVDTDGNIYVIDNHRIRKVDANGIITTIAGTGAFRFSGDGGLATNAQIGFPSSLAVDPEGTIYFADNANDRIRKVDTNGIITTIVGGTCNGVVATIDMKQLRLPLLTVGQNNFFVVTGTAGDDVILGTFTHDLIDGAGGNDIICGAGGGDVVIGGDGDDMIFGERGQDVLRGGPGEDEVHGGNGNDRVLGGIGNDTMTGGDGDDFLGGFGGDDTINGGPGSDRIFGGFGADTIHGDAGDDRINGLVGDDSIDGGDGDDTLGGDRGNDTLNGGPGADTLNGGNANDTLIGDAGDDRLNGGRADDQLSGGDDTDTCAGNDQNLADTADDTCETILGVP